MTFQRAGGLKSGAPVRAPDLRMNVGLPAVIVAFSGHFHCILIPMVEIV